MTTDPQAPFFNLVDEPWIPALDAAGRPVELSLRETFRQSRRLTALTGELPTQSVALLRLLLAVLHRAVEGPTDVGHWATIRGDWDQSLLDVDRYLDQWHDRFWLQHSTRPFMQVADLHTAKDEWFGLSRIVCDGPGTSAFMTTRLGASLERLSWQEAARWLVHVHAYDVAGIHSGAVGDPRVKGGKGYGIGTGWAGQIGSITVVGATLCDTLLLNLVAPAEVQLRGGPLDIPVWERVPLTVLPEGWSAGAGADQGYRPPTGPVDLYTWPARRVRLVGTAHEVVGVVNAQGDRATPHNRFDVEPLTAWRYSEPQTKVRGQDTYMPLKHDPGRSLWRGLEALLPGVSRPTRSGGPARRLPPVLVDWVRQLQGHGQIGDELLTFRAVGIEYGSNESVFDEVVSDDVALPAVLLDVPALAALALEAVDAADQAVFALGSLAQNVALAAGSSSESDGPRATATASAYAALDGEFRSWVRGLGRNTVPTEHRAAWQRTVHDVVSRLANDVVDAAGPAALVGRTSGGQFRDAGLAQRWFRKKLREVLPYAHDAGQRSDNPTQSQEVA